MSLRDACATQRASAKALRALRARCHVHARESYLRRGVQGREGDGGGRGGGGIFTTCSLARALSGPFLGSHNDTRASLCSFVIIQDKLRRVLQLPCLVSRLGSSPSLFCYFPPSAWPPRAAVVTRVCPVLPGTRDIGAFSSTCALQGMTETQPSQDTQLCSILSIGDRDLSCVGGAQRVGLET